MSGIHGPEPTRSCTSTDAPWSSETSTWTRKALRSSTVVPNPCVVTSASLETWLLTLKACVSGSIASLLWSRNVTVASHGESEGDGVGDSVGDGLTDGEGEGLREPDGLGEVDGLPDGL